MRIVCGLVILACVTRCFQYTVVERPALEIGTEVRIHMANARDLNVGMLTVADVNRMEGIVYEATPDTVALLSTWLFSAHGTRVRSNGEVYYWPRNEIPTVEVRKVQPAKTFVVLAIVAGLGYGVFQFVSDAGGGSEGQPPSPQFRLTIPIP